MATPDQVNPPTQPATAPAPAAAPEPSPAPANPPPPPTDQKPAEQPWRERVSGGDEEILRMASRYNSEHDFAKAFKELRTKLDSGEYKKAIPFPAEGTSEQQAAWRKEVGIPEKPSDYDLKFDNGIVIGEDVKPVVDKWLDRAHKLNMPPEHAKGAIASYLEIEQEILAEKSKEDHAFQIEQEEVLRGKWASDYLPNKNMAEDFAVSRFGEDVGKAIMAAGADAVESMAAIAREINPAATLVPNSSDPGKAIADRIAELESKMGTQEWKANTSWQQEYVRLVDGQNSMRKK